MKYNINVNFERKCSFTFTYTSIWYVIHHQINIYVYVMLQYFIQTYVIILQTNKTHQEY